MILVKDSKIFAISKDLANELELTLENLSEFVKKIEVSAITNEEVEILNNSFLIEEVPLITTENIKAYKLIKTAKSISDEFIKPAPEIPVPEIDKLPEPQIELPKELEKIEPEINKIPAPEIPKPIEELPKIEPNTTPPQKEEYKPKETPLETLNIEPKKEPQVFKEIKPQKEETTHITLTFEDEFSEIEALLNLSPQEAVENMEKELKEAAEELSIDLETINELYQDLFKMLKDEKDNFFKEIQNSNYDALHKIAHKLKGAALNLRLQNLALVLKTIDEMSKNREDISKIEYLTKKFYNFIENIELKPQQKELNIPPEIKELIVKTIEDYLATQNEKKFQKDKRYIEKLLKIEINSIEDLQNILKD